MEARVLVANIKGGRNAIINSVTKKGCGFGHNKTRIEPDGNTCLRDNKGPEPEIHDQIFDLECADGMPAVCIACLALQRI